jgi:methanethiol S-methyltransferase
MLKVAAATAVYGLVHSALASLAAKNRAARVFGERRRNGLYRAFYIAQSFITIAALGAFAWRQPNRELYRMKGWPAYAMHAGQVAALLYATWAARQVGLRRITGLGGLLAYRKGGLLPPEPEAQGPALDDEGKRNAIGAFAWSRHPLNFVPVPIFWLWPRMTTNLLAYNIAATLYLVLGSVHEEQRLTRTYGGLYEAYRFASRSLYIPMPVRDPSPSTAEFVGDRQEDQAAVIRTFVRIG